MYKKAYYANNNNKVEKKWICETMSHFHTPNYDISVTVCFVYHYTNIL